MNANGRRQRQAKNGYKHLAKRQRPKYKARDVSFLARREAEFRAKQRRIADNKAKGKK